MAKATKNTKSAQQSTKPAKGAKSAQQAPATTGAKVAKVAKGAKSAPATKAATKASTKSATQSGQQGRRSQFAGMKIRSLVGKGEAHGARGNAGVLFETVTKHKLADDALGASYKRVGGKFDGETWRVLPVDLAYLVERGLIAVE